MYDICIIGGGINGAGIAHEASKIGLKVYLCEQDDFAGKTSSNSTKLIHGGLRYLEHYEFSLVRAALKERENLHKIASHIIKPLDFIFIHNPNIRNKWLVRAGLFLYDLLAGKNNKYKKSKGINLLNSPQCFRDLDKNISNTFGFLYSDLWVDDARLTLLNILSAKNNGASVNKNTEIINTQYNIKQKLWHLKLLNKRTQEHTEITAKIIINATGPWINKVLTSLTSEVPNYDIRLVQGSHIIVPKLYADPHCYVLQHKDNRIIFTIPYQDNYTLIGTTEEEFNAKNLNTNLVISELEIEYLLNICNSFFYNKITKDDIVWAYSGVRPLFNQANKVNSSNTRDYYIERYQSKRKDIGPIINIYGGKITTYRLLANKVIMMLLNNYTFVSKPQRNIQLQPLPGCNLNIFDLEQYQQNLNYQDYYVNNLINKYSWLPLKLARRYATTYGLLAEQFLEKSNSINDLGIHFGAGLYSKELLYLINDEFADTVEDVIWRRTKLGLELTKEQIKIISDYIDSLRS
jgi:glycerol-3-phosphate dehydrogenase